MGLTLITGTTGEILSLEELKEQVRVTDEQEEGLLAFFLAAATEDLEREMRRQFLNATYDLTLDNFDNPMVIPKPPLSSITSITYVDTAGDSQTLATTVYDVDTTQEPGLVRLAYGETWPATRTVWNAVVIRFVAGYGAIGDVPNSIKQAARLLVAHYYENRAAVDLLEPGKRFQEVPWAIKRLVWGNKIPTYA